MKALAKTSGFTILGQIYIVKMAIFDQISRHRRKLSYNDFKDIFGTNWKGVKVATVATAKLRIALIQHTL